MRFFCCETLFGCEALFFVQAISTRAVFGYELRQTTGRAREPFNGCFNELGRSFSVDFGAAKPASIEC